MRGLGILFAIVIVTAACSSSSDDEPMCKDISGNYNVTVARLSGTCDPSSDPKTASISFANEGGTWVAKLPSIPGGCPGTLDTKTCKFTSQCELKAQDGSVLGTGSLDYTFSPSGYTGTSANGLRPPAVQTACDVTYRETATKL